MYKAPHFRIRWDRGGCEEVEKHELDIMMANASSMQAGGDGHSAAAMQAAYQTPAAGVYPPPAVRGESQCDLV